VCVCVSECVCVCVCVCARARGGGGWGIDQRLLFHKLKESQHTSEHARGARKVNTQRDRGTHRCSRACCHRLHLHLLLLHLHAVVAGCLDSEQDTEKNNHKIKTAKKRSEENKKIQIRDLRLREEHLILGRARRGSVCNLYDHVQVPGAMGVCKHKGECEHRVEHGVQHDRTEWNKAVGVCKHKGECEHRMHW
jgi:hypothetical protein